MVLNTNADTGAAGDGSREVSALRTGSVPSTAPRSAGEGKRSTTSSSRGCTPTLRRRGDREHREELARHHRVAEALHEVVVGEGPLLEELLHQALVGLGHHLHELVERFLRRVLHLVRHLHRLELAGEVVGVDVGAVGEKVDHAHEALLLAQGDGHRHDPSPERGFEGLEGAGERGPLAVHAVHDQDPGQGVLGGVAPHLLGLDLDSGHRVHHDQGRVGHAQGRPGPRTGNWRSRERRGG